MWKSLNKVKEIGSRKSKSRICQDVEPGDLLWYGTTGRSSYIFEVSRACFVAHKLHFAISRAFLLALNFINRQKRLEKWTDLMFDLQWVSLYSGRRPVFTVSAPLQRNFPHSSSFQLFWYSVTLENRFLLVSWADLQPLWEQGVWAAQRFWSINS